MSIGAVPLKTSRARATCGFCSAVVILSVTNRRSTVRESQYRSESPRMAPRAPARITRHSSMVESGCAASVEAVVSSDSLGKMGMIESKTTNEKMTR